MKSNTLHFSPTSAGVRIDHLNLQKSNSDKNNSISSNNCCNNIIDCNNKDNFSLPRARVSPQTSQDEGEFKHFLEQIVIRNHPSSGSVPDKTDKNCPHTHPTRLRQKPTNKMRNCLLIAGAAVILSLLSFVFLVECRSVKGGTHSKKNYDVEISSESRIQDTSVQEPDPESSEEYPTKVLSTTSTSKDATSSSSSPLSSTTKSSSTTKRTSGTSPTSAGRLTRSRVSVICKGGHFGVTEEDLSTTSTTSTAPSSAKKSHNKHPVNFYNNPILHRVSDDDDEDDDEEEEEDKGGEKTDWGDDDEEDAALSQEESQQKVITVTGYSQVAGGKPETKALVKSGSNTAIKYVPKPSKNGESSANEDDNEGSASSEEEQVVTVKPKAKHQKAKPKARPVSHKSHTAPVTSTTTETAPPSTTSKSSSHKKSKQTQPPRNKRESSEENDEEEEVTTAAPRASKNSSKHGSKKGSKGSRSKDNQTTSTTKAPKNQKGDSGELEDEDGDESLFPTLRKSKSESKREKGRKASERRQKPPAVIQLIENSDLESAEAEPESVTTEAARKVESSSSRKSSRSKRPKNGDGTSSKKESPSPKPLAIKEDSSSIEEYNMEEMPFSAPSQHESGSTKKKSRRSSSSGSKSSRMTSRTAAPKQRTGAFSSDEID